MAASVVAMLFFLRVDIAGKSRNNYVQTYKLGLMLEARPNEGRRGRRIYISQVARQQGYLFIGKTEEVRAVN